MGVPLKQLFACLKKKSIMHLAEYFLSFVTLWQWLQAAWGISIFQCIYLAYSTDFTHPAFITFFICNFLSEAREKIKSI